jgi:Tfp pilus assembly protein PilN
VSQVNLLPPELLARQKTRRLTSLVVGAGAVLIALLVVFWFLQGQKLAGVNDDIAAQNAVNAQLQQEIDNLAEAEALQAEAASKQQLLSEAYAGEVSWSQFLMDMSLVIPSDAYLKSLAATLTAASTTADTSTTSGTSGATSFAGGFTVTGGADGFDSLASWLTRVESVRGWVNPWLSGATETAAHSGLYTFDSGADLSDEALTARGSQAATGG